MKGKKAIKESLIPRLIAGLREQGNRVIAPVLKGEKVIFAAVDTADKITLNYIQSAVSSKESVFPRYQSILNYEMKGRDVQLSDNTNNVAKTVVFGTRPCDAASYKTIDAVFTWDRDDFFYKNRRENTVIVSISCAKADGYCFCTSVGGGPGNTDGSDILLTKIGDMYLAEILSEKGEALVSSMPEIFTDADISDDEKSKNIAVLKPAFDVQNLIKKLSNSFDEKFFLDQSLRCVGCGACAFVCPSCTCFDIQDETSGSKGVRLRCWDSCGFGHFTMHTSWHNPRNIQSKRWRQRILHKFYYQPDRLNILGCSGCGRCSRACPADMNILEHLNKIAE